MRKRTLLVFAFLTFVYTLFAQKVEILSCEYKGNFYQTGSEFSVKKGTQVKVVINNPEKGYFYAIKEVRLTFYFENDEGELIAGKPVGVAGSDYLQNPWCFVLFPDNEAVKAELDVAIVKRKNRAGEVFPVWFTKRDRTFNILLRE